MFAEAIRDVFVAPARYTFPRASDLLCRGPVDKRTFAAAQVFLRERATKMSPGIQMGGCPPCLRGQLYTSLPLSAVHLLHITSNASRSSQR